MLLFTHPSGFDHLTGEGHPERPARLRAVLDALAAPRFAALERREAPPAHLEHLRRVHGAAYIDGLAQIVPAAGLRRLDADTVMSPGSWSAALHAAGAAVAAVAAVLSGPERIAFCATRPPGHHAEPGYAMGFCLLNNVMIGAAHALASGLVQRVAIVDFDVHHGNGSQTMAAPHAGLFYLSAHQGPLYPGTGWPHERGEHDNVLNLTFPAGTEGPDWRARLVAEALPALDGFRPQLLMISAGFDAHRRDPLAGLRLDEADFAWLTEALVRIAARHAGGRIVSILEGGYDLEALAAATAAHVAVLMAFEAGDSTL